MESIILYFKEKGYNVYFLTLCEKGIIHEKLKDNGVQIIEFNRLETGIFKYFFWVRFLINFCKKNDIHFIHSHLQISNFVSSIASYFIKSKVFTVRHNSDVIFLSGSKKEKMMEKIINALSNYIIAISDKVKQQLINVENVNQRKVFRINNGYDFSKYQELSLSENEYLSIRDKYNAQHLIVSPGRLIDTKRHEISIEAIKRLVEKGVDVKMIILGEGPLQTKLTNLIKQKQLQNHVFLLGYQPNISDYIKASNSIVLLSESEASSNTIKEAGYFKKTVIVCENVGDFDDYVLHNINGFIISKKAPLFPFIATIESIINDPQSSIILGENLYNTIMVEFDIKIIGPKYEDLQGSLGRL
jgi:glycosyltransferase involved in cell wall biosynthesis